MQTNKKIYLLLFLITLLLFPKANASTWTNGKLVIYNKSSKAHYLTITNYCRYPDGEPSYPLKGKECILYAQQNIVFSNNYFMDTALYLNSGAYTAFNAFIRNKYIDIKLDNNHILVYYDSSLGKYVGVGAGWTSDLARQPNTYYSCANGTLTFRGTEDTEASMNLKKPICHNPDFTPYAYKVIIDPRLLVDGPISVHMNSYAPDAYHIAPFEDKPVNINYNTKTGKGKRDAAMPVYLCHNAKGIDKMGKPTYYPSFTISQLQLFNKKKKLIYSATMTWVSEAVSMCHPYPEASLIPYFKPDRKYSFKNNPIKMYVKNQTIYIMLGAVESAGVWNSKCSYDMEALESWVANNGRNTKADYIEDDLNKFWNSSKTQQGWKVYSQPDIFKLRSSGCYVIPFTDFGYSINSDNLVLRSAQDAHFKIRTWNKDWTYDMPGNPTDLTNIFKSGYTCYSIYCISASYKVWKDGKWVPQTDRLYLGYDRDHYVVLGADSGTWKIDLAEHMWFYDFVVGEIAHVGYSPNPNVLIKTSEMYNQTDVTKAQMDTLKPNAKDSIHD